MTDLPNLSRPNISDEVYRILKQQILSRAFAPGQRLDLNEIGKKMGISRTPLKVGLSRLVADGLVEIVPRSGTYVADLNIQDIEELFDLRRVLEVYAAESAVENATEDTMREARTIVEKLRALVASGDWKNIYPQHIDLDHDLHRLIIESTGKRHLKQLWEQVNVHVQIARVRYRSTEKTLDVSMEEHEQIVSALEARDASALRTALDRHIARGRQTLRADWESSHPD
jgi:DNA-binding GntR family transcriptional regulator